MHQQTSGIVTQNRPQLVPHSFHLTLQHIHIVMRYSGKVLCISLRSFCYLYISLLQVLWCRWRVYHCWWHWHSWIGPFMVAGKLHWIHKSRTSVICYQHHGKHSLWKTQCIRQWGTTILLWEISYSGIHMLLYSGVMTIKCLSMSLVCVVSTRFCFTQSTTTKMQLDIWTIIFFIFHQAL